MDPLQTRWSIESARLPDRPSTQVRFSVPSEGIATLRVFTTLGQQIKTLFNGTVEPGRNYSVEFSADDLPAGFYLARLDHQGRHVMHRILLTR
ncbi:MAG: T9SS type A sorting domain-containing protein [Bacteroidetes bacterium]|jgi:hypothetical protein|nr:T9SS type A sorting domain-containing protein [Bacteroidota bacterium]